MRKNRNLENTDFDFAEPQPRPADDAFTVETLSKLDRLKAPKIPELDNEGQDDAMPEHKRQALRDRRRRALQYIGGFSDECDL